MRFFQQRRRTAGLCLIAALILTFWLPSCGTLRARFTVQSFDCFDTVTTITGYASSREEFERVSGEILADLRDYHRLFDIYHAYEGTPNLYTVNQVTDGAHPVVEADQRLLDFLLYAKDMYALTGGTVNIALGSVLSIWHDCREQGLAHPDEAALPSRAELERAAAHTSLDALVLDPEARTIHLTDPAVTLDVGALGKGYAVEMAARALEAAGVTGYILNVGGNVRVVGPKNEGGGGEPWTVGVENPAGDDDRPYVAEVYLDGKTSRAQVTSGAYQRFYTVSGKKYHHIIDPETLMPAEGYASVSVLAADSALADALSTALFCMDFDRGRRLAESLDEVEVLWVFPSGEIRTTEGFGEVGQIRP